MNSDCTTKLCLKRRSNKLWMRTYKNAFRVYFVSMKSILSLILVAVVSMAIGCNGQKTADKKNTSPETSSVGQSSSNQELMDTVQRQTFDYFWEGAEPTSGLARERIHMDNIYPTHDKDITVSYTYLRAHETD